MKNNLTKILMIWACVLTGTQGRAVILNGGFENGLANFTEKGSNSLTQNSGVPPALSTGMGNAFTTGSMSGLLPLEGKSFAVIANGDLSGKSSPLTATQISQTFTLGTGLSFNYDFLTNEIAQPAYFNDTFAVTLSTMSGPILKLDKLSVQQNSSFSNLGGFAGSTGWLGFYLDTSSFSGQTATLSFTVWDVGDSAVNSALAIDNINVVQAEVAPEPGTIAFGAGLLGVCLASLSRRVFRR